MKDHIKDVESIIEYLAGKMSPRERERFEARLAADNELSEMYKLVRSLREKSLQTSGRDDAVALRELSVDMFRAFQKAGRGKDVPRALKVYDSKTLPLPTGVRPSLASARRVKYRSESLAVNIAMYPVSLHSYEIIGQISGLESSQPFQIKLKGTRETFRAESDQSHLFIFPRVPAGKYDLTVMSHGKVMSVIDIDL